MSVHGEYERSLGEMILRLRQLPEKSGRSWVDAFETLRMRNQPDLSTAAQKSLEMLDQMGEAISISASPDPAEAKRGEKPTSNVLRDTASHLAAHCRAILGVPADCDR